jgi:hypothetical protein
MARIIALVFKPHLVSDGPLTCRVGKPDLYASGPGVIITRIDREPDGYRVRNSEGGSFALAAIYVKSVEHE